MPAALLSRSRLAGSCTAENTPVPTDELANEIYYYGGGRGGPPGGGEGGGENEADPEIRNETNNGNRRKTQESSRLGMYLSTLIANRILACLALDRYLPKNTHDCVVQTKPPPGSSPSVILLAPLPPFVRFFHHTRLAKLGICPFIFPSPSDPVRNKHHHHHHHHLHHHNHHHDAP